MLEPEDYDRSKHTVCICWRTNRLQFCIILARFFLLDSSSSPRLRPRAEASGMVRNARRKLLACKSINGEREYAFCGLNLCQRIKEQANHMYLANGYSGFGGHRFIEMPKNRQRCSNRMNNVKIKWIQ